MIELKENKELSGERKKQNEDLLNEHFNEFLKFESDANIKKLSTAFFFERVWDYQAKNTTLLHRLMFNHLEQTIYILSRDKR